MPQYLVAVHHPIDFEPASESEQTRRDISALNVKMRAAGIVVFVGGLDRSSTAKSVRLKPDGGLLVTDGPYIETKEQMAGFALIEARDMAESVAIAGEDPMAEYGTIEVRPVYEIPA